MYFDGEIPYYRLIGKLNPDKTPETPDSSGSKSSDCKQRLCGNNIQQVFLTTEQFQGQTKNKNSVSKKLTKEHFKIYFEKIINQIILFYGKPYKKDLIYLFKNINSFLHIF